MITLLQGRFQFQRGSIKGVPDAASAGIGTSFQFQRGSIKGGVGKTTTTSNLGFNSSVVRLKVVSLDEASVLRS